MAKNVTPEFNLHVMNGHGGAALVVSLKKITSLKRYSIKVKMPIQNWSFRVRERQDLYKIGDFKDENGKDFAIFIEGINHDFLFVDFPSEKVVVSSFLYDASTDSDRTSSHIYRDKAILYVIEVENNLVTPVKQTKLGDARNAHKYYVGLRDEPLELNNGKNVLPYCDRINAFIDVIESGKINYKEGFDKTDVYKFLERTIINDFGWMFEKKDDLKAM